MRKEPADREQQSVEQMMRRIEQAQERARKHLKAREQLVDDFLAERRNAAEEE